MKTILVPTDFSTQADNALDMALQVAKINGSKVLLINVIEGMRSFSFNTMGELEDSTGEEAYLVKKLVDQTKSNLDDALSNLDTDGVEIEAMVEIGSPYESIAHVITNHDADLVVMGTKGSGGVEEVLIGSNTEKVVRYAKCPVITIKDKVDLDKVKHIVFATSLMEDQPDIVERLKLARENFGVKLHLVKVNTPNNFHTERQLREEFQKYLEKHDLKDCETHVYNEASEEDGILYFAEDLGDCMIAIGTHGRTGLLHLLSGSIAEDLVNHSKVPVWTFSMKK
ncbi:universal stress protein [Roseivirga pacifica]|uniref:universal stress protein n=1 Tax=Roseivirga pacifica TaxID=1267423 RepID=UPI00209479BB|nr:universal stress protein [Roseivirga pacifica]MCO6357750.1 universal stress protein [Roseivirga pacifica]MCO6366003.1 universal stress protein [Roseivirga pacifica]MCO6371331.1 universal stress protein [Roseivirga pacifica]MCO6375498.1 universal stress protein [Roseivirga pacifica]MCO6378709.1 universal stress protein [Roseivirga pacifica]